MEFEKCKCGKLAVYWYAPGYEGKKDEESYFCEDCVSRGCSCNNYSTRDEDYAPPGGISPNEKDGEVKWIDEHTWTHVDEQGREYPCCEYWYDKEGFEIYEPVVLYRPVNQHELALIKESGYTSFPPRLPEQPFFYPVLNEEYAIQITDEWNVPKYGFGYVVKFEINKKYFDKFEIHNVGGFIHNELWVPSEKMEEFNMHINGKIEVIHEFKNTNK